MIMPITPTIHTEIMDISRIPFETQLIKKDYQLIRPSIDIQAVINLRDNIRIYSDIHAISSALLKINYLSIESVKQQAIDLLFSIQGILSKSIVIYGISRRYPQILLNELDDSTALVEWNFETLRVGFILEQNPDESTFYIITYDLINEGFNSITNKLTNDLDKTVQAIVDYIIRNT
jgi:hypothetical protein